MKFACKRIIKRGSSFESQLMEHAREFNCSGVVCGHIHRPAVTEMEGGFVYVNAGDWVENCTAVVEDMEGNINLLWWKDLEGALEEVPVGPVMENLPIASLAAR
jgi:UDP-2,3-diacylglucosamine pyrophosphatase LpxH